MSEQGTMWDAIYTWDGDVFSDPPVVALRLTRHARPVIIEPGCASDLRPMNVEHLG